ncbi:MAG: MBL fold metallo-hydrolase, partial [candidate division Zixibacteria bacterium]|nr:MBL fold metallo-hydrolase [candidate division Zixibacteria bacterium]
MKVVPLGIGGFIPTEEYQTSCILVREGNTAILFDAGTGISRLFRREIRRMLNDVDALNLILSHYHLDHIIGITWLVKLWDRKLRIYAPTEPIVQSTPGIALKLLTDLPLFGLRIEQFPFPTEIIPIEGNDIMIDGIRLSMIKQRHIGGSVGYKLGNKLAYITDTDPEDDHVAFIENVKLVFLDCMFDLQEHTELCAGKEVKLEHGYSIGNAQLARKANV